MSSAIFVHLSPVYLRLSFLFLGPVYRVLSPDICQDWNLITVNCSQCLLILLCTSGKGYHMMATIKMPQQGRDCYCCNSQGILIFAIHVLFNFVIFFVSILSGKCLSTQSIACPPSSLYVHQTTFKSQSSTNSILLVSIHALGENQIGSGLGIWRSWPSAVKV